MAKGSPNTKPKTETPFQKFQALARRIVHAPKYRGPGAKRDKP
jgi:hypothetical protein